MILDIDRYTGAYITGWPRCAQSIETILTTRLHTRLMRLWWGSQYLDMMDKPMIAETFVKGIGEALRVINLYEPEFKVRDLSMMPYETGVCVAIVNGIFLPDLTPQTSRVILN